MSTHTPPINYPKPYNVNWRFWCRNGTVVSGGTQIFYSSTNHILAYRRKVWGEKSLPLTTIPTGISGTNELFYFAGHTGHGIKELRADWILATANVDPPQDPYVYIEATPIAGGTTLTSSEFHHGGVNPSPDDAPDEFATGRTTITGIASNTSYYVTVKAVAYARVIACTVYEVGDDPVDTADGGVDPGIGDFVPILDSQLAQLMPAQTNIWKHNAGVVLQWTRDTALLAPSTTSTTYNNIIDAGTTVSASSPGLRVNLQYHNTVAQTTVPVKMFVRAVRTAGTTAGSVRVTDGTNSVEVTGIDDVTNWYTATGTMPATDQQKWDFQFKAGTLSTLRVDAIYVVEHQA